MTESRIARDPGARRASAPPTRIAEVIEKVVERFGRMRVIVAGKTFAGGSEQSFAFVALVELRGFALEIDLAVSWGRADLRSRRLG